ncbi:unnamed protein product [Polarella glacialis]|uniref:mannosyl-oligosaccharide glucosidase n=1 Tax=Polarella glacialis TaxID=89957 RepID=A0A813H861_POLGL|nr:unnamed protein product [Polarella glacialis]
MCYKWAGRTAAHCLASGLDDYPRGLMINDDECHLDLHSWMTLFAGTMASFCRQLTSWHSSDGQTAALCDAPGWAQRAATLNATLHEVFVGSSKGSGVPLADFMGDQPVAKGGRVMVVPPWRTDGRCGPQFPTERGPGDCDPYGGSPCCSPSGWCGGSPDFCNCQGCRRCLKLEERQGLLKTKPYHSPHLGYVSLFPLGLGLLPCDHPRARQLLEALKPGSADGTGGGKLWSRHGVMSLSSQDPLFRQGEDYWRGKVWANLNYLTISALSRCASHPDPAVKELAGQAHASLREGFVSTVLQALKKQRFFFENFDPDTGQGTGVGPFTGWTTLVALVMADLPLALDDQQLPADGREGQAAEL